MVSFVYVFVVLTILSMDLRISQATSRLNLHDPSSVADYHEFEQWVIKNSRVYNNESEKQMRFEIFKEKLKYIEEFNKGNHTFTVGLNPYSDLTEEELIKRHTCHLMKGNNDITLPKVFRSQKNASYAVAESKDWRNEGAVTYVRTQGVCGGCWAFATVAAVEGVMKVSRGRIVALSEQQLIDCVRYNKGCEGGSKENAFAYIAQNRGISSARDYPYLYRQGYCQNKASAMEIKMYEHVPEDDEDELLAAVNRQPISVNVFSDIASFHEYKGGVYQDRKCAGEPTHSMTLVGYGTAPDGMKYWLAKNSWGIGWGENGYMRLRRDVEWRSGMCGLARTPAYPLVG